MAQAREQAPMRSILERGLPVGWMLRREQGCSSGRQMQEPAQGRARSLAALTAARAEGASDTGPQN